MNAVLEFQRLAATRPGPNADADECASWYERKADLHAALAADSVAELGYAVAAYEHAAALTTVTSRARELTTPRAHIKHTRPSNRSVYSA